LEKFIGAMKVLIPGCVVVSKSIGRKKIRAGLYIENKNEYVGELQSVDVFVGLWSCVNCFQPFLVVTI
jgi:hypothetical protein